MSKIVIVLVHGTWGRGFLRKQPIASWCKPDSNFVRRLTDECKQRMPNIPTSVVPFNWSGDNSILQRAKAATDLKIVLESHVTPNTSVLIIAHSHGGNVAIQAITKLGQVSKIYVCTLATPFLRIFESTREFYGSENVLIGAGIVTSTFALYLLAIILDIGDSSLTQFLAFAVIAGFVCSWAIGSFLERLLINPLPKSNALTPWQMKPRLLSEATAADANLLDDRLLILRGIDDEAALSLAAGALTNRLLRFLYNFIATTSVFILLVVMFLLIWATKNGNIIFFTMTFLFSVALLCLFLPSVTRPVFGTELAFGAARCDTLYDSVPDSDRAKVVTLRAETDQDQLVHAIHQHPAAPQLVVDWFATHIAAVKPDS
jgi:hypothetical protein